MIRAEQVAVGVRNKIVGMDRAEKKRWILRLGVAYACKARLKHPRRAWTDVLTVLSCHGISLRKQKDPGIRCWQIS